MEGELQGKECGGWQDRARERAFLASICRVVVVLAASAAVLAPPEPPGQRCGRSD